MSLIYARLALRRLAARLTLLVVATLLIGSPTSAPAGAATGNRPVYLPIIYVAGDAKIDVNTELIANTIVAPGDRIWVKFNVHNSGNAVTATKTAINLPFDKNELDYYTEDIDTSRGDAFLGIDQGSEVRLEVGSVQPNTTATVSVWFNVKNDVANGTQISLRANYTYNGQNRESNEVSVYVNPPGSVSGFCGPFSGTNGRMTVLPDTGAAGTIFNFESNCFEPQEEVVTWLNTPSGVAPLELRATADSIGHVSFQLNSRGFAPGTNYGLVAQGLTSDIQVLGPFVVLPSGLAQAADGLASGSPATIPRPTTAAAQASGGIQGLVTGDGGAPLADVLVIVDSNSGGIEDSGVTDASGAYNLSVLSDGAYTIHFKTDRTSSAATAAYAGTTRTVTVSGGLATLNVQLQRGGRVSGVVTGVGNGPLEGVFVLVFDSGNKLIATTSTNASGGYTTGALSSGTYRLQFDPTISQVVSTTMYLVKERANITVTAPATTSGVNVALDPDPNVRQYAGRVTAQGSGAPLAGVSVIAYSATTGKLADIVTTESDGTYHSHNMASGTYQVYFLTMFSTNTTSRTYIGAKLGATLDLTTPGLHSGVDIALARGGRISGKVTSLDTGAALKAVEVAVRVPATGQIVGVGLTDASGNYLTSGLPSGTYRVEFVPDHSPVIETATYQRATIENVVVSGTNVVTGVDAQLVRDPRKIVFLPLIQRT